MHSIPITLHTSLPSCQSIGHDNHNQILKDIKTFALEEYIEEITGAVPEGIV
jgi:regulator of nonsense transcripts 2